MALDSPEVADLVISQPQPLFEVLDHLFDLPAVGVELYDLQSRQKKVGGNQVADFFPFLLDDNHSNRPDPFYDGDKLGYL